MKFSRHLLLMGLLALGLAQSASAAGDQHSPGPDQEASVGFTPSPAQLPGKSGSARSSIKTHIVPGEPDSARSARQHGKPPIKSK